MRSDRQPYGVYPRRNWWTGYYYNSAGKRVSNVRLTTFEGSPPRPFRLPVIGEDPDRCPNRNRALELIKQIAECPSQPYVQVPDLVDAVELWHQSLLLDGCQPASTGRRVDLVRHVIQGIPPRGNKGYALRVGPIIAGTGWKSFDHVTILGFREFLQRAANAGRAPRTRNFYQEGFSLFLDFAVSSNWIKTNPLLGSRKAKVGLGNYNRRALSKEEFRALLETSCPEHSIFYLAMGLAGFRIEEATLLRGRDCYPIGENPIWKLPAEIQKVETNETLPMMPRLAKALAQRWYNVGLDGLLFPDAPKRRVLYKDLARAGIPRVNDRKEHISYHSFRYFFATEMSQIFPIRKVQILMRHKSVEMTERIYVKLHLRKKGEEWKIPDIEF